MTTDEGIVGIAVSLTLGGAIALMSTDTPAPQAAERTVQPCFAIAMPNGTTIEAGSPLTYNIATRLVILQPCVMFKDGFE